MQPLRKKEAEGTTSLFYTCKCQKKMVLGLRVATTHMLLTFTTQLISNQLTVKNKKWQLFTDTQKMHSIAWNQNCSWALKRCIQWFEIWPEYDPIRKDAFKSWLNLSFPNLHNPSFSSISNSKNLFQRWIFATEMKSSLTQHSHPGLIEPVPYPPM
jgi:hypothetical protein